MLYMSQPKIYTQESIQYTQMHQWGTVYTQFSDRGHNWQRVLHIPTCMMYI